MPTATPYEFLVRINPDGTLSGIHRRDYAATDPEVLLGPARQITVEDLQKLLENPQANGMALFFAGKLKVTGNPALVTKLPTLFTRT